jgi:hypothetical protein
MEDIKQAIEKIEKVAEIWKNDERALSTAQNEILCLRLKGGETTAMPCILEIPFDSLSATPLSLNCVTPCRFRFLNLRSFLSRAIVQYPISGVG